MKNGLNSATTFHYALNLMMSKDHFIVKAEVFLETAQSMFKHLPWANQRIVSFFCFIIRTSREC
jgi:hypothetical protein